MRIRRGFSLKGRERIWYTCSSLSLVRINGYCVTVRLFFLLLLFLLPHSLFIPLSVFVSLCLSVSISVYSSHCLCLCLSLTHSLSFSQQVKRRIKQTRGYNSLVSSNSKSPARSVSGLRDSVSCAVVSSTSSPLVLQKENLPSVLTWLVGMSPNTRQRSTCIVCRLCHQRKLFSYHLIVAMISQCG